MFAFGHGQNAYVHIWPLYWSNDQCSCSAGILVSLQMFMLDQYAGQQGDEYVLQIYWSTY